MQQVEWMQQEEWDALNLQEIPCPKCGVIGRLQRSGRDRHGHYHNVSCGSCGSQSSERLLALPTNATPQLTRSNNTTALKEMLTKLAERLDRLEGKVIEPAEITFNWDDYSEEKQMKLQQLIGILREHRKWGTYKLQKELQRLGMGVAIQDIIKVKNVFLKGDFDV